MSDIPSSLLLQLRRPVGLVYGLNSWTPFAFAAISAAVGWLAGILAFNHPLRQKINVLLLKLWNPTKAAAP